MKIQYPIHPNKNAKGFSANQQKQFYKKRTKGYIQGYYKPIGKDDINNALKLYGTCDPLAKNIYNHKLIDVEHSTDKGYFKKAYVISRQGKLKLNKLKLNKLKIKTP